MRHTRQANLGTVTIGGGASVSIQSMTTLRTANVSGVKAQIDALVKAGCEIVRVAVRDRDDADALPAILDGLSIPLVADIHFHADLALLAIRHGVHGIRVNPGNIGGEKGLEAVVNAARKRDVCIRVGVNGGSLERRFGKATPENLAKSALDKLSMIEKLGHANLKASLKASDPSLTLQANRLFAARSDIPLHLGLTEAGPPLSGAVRSSAVMSLLLSEGIGDTIRISLSGDPVREVLVAKTLLETLRLREPGGRVISCPTCGRCRLENLAEIAGEAETMLLQTGRPVTIAVMGCEVNGPKEAKQADIGIFGGGEKAVFLVKNRPPRTVPTPHILSTLKGILADWPETREP